MLHVEANVMTYLNVTCQLETVSGTVMDSIGNPISGALVEMAGTGISTFSQPDGTYSLEVAQSEYLLRFTASGYYGAQVLLEVPAGGLFLNVGLDTPVEMQTRYDSFGPLLLDPADGTVIVAFFDEFLATQNSSLIFDNIGFDGSTMELFYMNVPPGDYTFTGMTGDSGSDCVRFDFAGAPATLPFPVNVQPSVSTVVPVFCN